MSSSSFTGGGVSDFFTLPDGFTNRSMQQPQAEATVAASMNRNPNHMASLSLYRQQHQQQMFQQQQQQQHLPALFLDPSAQNAHQIQPTLMGKRNLSEFQTYQNNPILSNLILRSVKPRTFQQGPQLSPLSPMDISMSPKLPNPASSVFTTPSTSQRFNNVPVLPQHFHSNQVHLSNGSTLSLPMSSNTMNTAAFIANTNGGLGLKNTDLGPVHTRGMPVPQESEKKMIDNRLLELEKQLLEDDNDDEGDGVSVVTNSEWSDTIQNLISPGTQNLNQKLLSTSPTSSTTSSCSSTSSVASPTSICSKQSLMEAASAISEGKSETASEILSRLSQISNAGGNSEQRLADHMVSALKSRVNPVENPPQIAELFSREHAESTQLLFDVSPCFKLGFMTANLAILEATLDDTAAETKFHVIDFDIGLGNQYVNLLHTLAAQQNGKPATVKITAVTDNGSKDKLQSVGDMLRRLAERVNLHFEFNVVSHTLVELSRESLGCDPDETIAVNFAFKLYRMPDESVSIDNPRDELLRRVKSLAPKVVTLVEQELNTNTAPFMARVSESCSYYGALFDSLESTVSRDNSDRFKVEEGLSRKLSNSIACEGRDRFERCEVFGKWRARMGMAGFQLRQMSQNVAELMRVRLNSGNRVNPGFTVKEENGGICFGWMGRTLTVASAWR